jgi:L-threonylcarbamoyladenylate synthase
MSYTYDIQECLKVLEAGGLILYPTDTVWGIGCDATNAEAVNRIYKLKQRNESKSMIILLDEESSISQYTDQEEPTIFDYIKGIHKPVTVIYQQAKNLAPNLINQDGSIGIRIVKDPFCKKLIAAFGKPIVSTSSNISGYPPPAFFHDIDVHIKKGVDYIVHHRQDDMVPAEPSSVVRMDASGKIEILRP